MQGLGNDFVVFDDLDDPARAESPVTADLARAVCDRRFGIGADQVLWLRKARHPEADARMEILNADGSVAEMCGNGIRTVALILFRRANGRREFVIETLAGLKSVDVDPGKGTVRVGMGAPSVDPSVAKGGEILDWCDGTQSLVFPVNVGNPHAVLFLKDLSKAQLERLGPLIEAHPRFPNRTNVEFVEVRGPSSLRMRVWERGSGVTLACGTGACASVVAARAAGRIQAETVEVLLDGGTLLVSWAGEGTQVYLEGPAEEAFRGVWRR